MKDLLKRGIYFETDEGGGGSPPAEPVEPVEEPTEPIEPEEPAEPTETEEPEEAPSAPRELTDDEIIAKAEALGLKRPEPAKEPERDPSIPPEVRDTRAEAFAEARKYPQFLDEDGRLTQAGVDWAESRAIDLAMDAKIAAREEREAVARVEAALPQVTEHATNWFKSNGYADDQAAEAGKAYAERMVRLGPAAFEPDPAPTDTGEVLHRRQIAQQMRSDAYYIALGKIKEAEIKGAAKNDDAPPLDAGKKNRGGVGGSASNGDLVSKVTKNPANAAFVKDWKDEYGRDLTRDEVTKFVKEGILAA